MKTGLANFSQLRLSNSLFTVLFAYVVFFFWLVLWLGICVEVDVDRITILPPSLFFSLPFFLPFPYLSLTQVTVISLKSAGA